MKIFFLSLQTLHFIFLEGPLKNTCVCLLLGVDKITLVKYLAVESVQDNLQSCDV